MNTENKFIQFDINFLKKKLEVANTAETQFRKKIKKLREQRKKDASSYVKNKSLTNKKFGEAFISLTKTNLSVGSTIMKNIT